MLERTAALYDEYLALSDLAAFTRVDDEVQQSSDYTPIGFVVWPQ
jgi:hypothetical protein